MAVQITLHDTENRLDECAWCSDYRHQHDENGCCICRFNRAPWETGPYYCDKFYESHKEAENAFVRRAKAAGILDD